MSLINQTIAFYLYLILASLNTGKLVGSPVKSSESKSWLDQRSVDRKFTFDFTRIAAQVYKILGHCEICMPTQQILLEYIPLLNH